MTVVHEERESNSALKEDMVQNKDRSLSRSRSALAVQKNVTNTAFNPVIESNNFEALEAKNSYRSNDHEPPLIESHHSEKEAHNEYIN